MSGQNIVTPSSGGRVNPARIVPALPSDIPILPGQVKARKRRLPGGLIFLLVILGLVALSWHNVSNPTNQTDKLNKQMEDDDRAVLQAVTPAMIAHAPRMTRIPVTLSDGPRILQIEFTVVHHERKPLQTCVWLGVLDPKTGARVDQKMPCVPGVDYVLKQQ
jgi:hypothetical protein